MSPGPAKSFSPDEALERAMEVFRSRGYEAAGLRELLEEMGISRKSMYDTFGNKRSLFRSAVDRYAASQRQLMRSMLERPGSPLANIESALMYMAREHSRPGGIGCGIGNSIADFTDDDEDIAAVLRGHLAANEREWRAVLRRARGANEIVAETDIEGLARLLSTVAQGIALTGRVASDPTVEFDAIRSLIALIRAPSLDTNRT